VTAADCYTHPKLLYEHAKMPPSTGIHTHSHVAVPLCMCVCSCSGHTDKLKCYKKANEARTRFTNQANSFYDVRCRSCCFCQSFADVGDKQKKKLKNLRCQNLANHVFFSLCLPPLLLFSLPLITHHLSLAFVGVEKKKHEG